MNSRWSGWVNLGAWLMVIVGGLDVFEGLIAIIRGEYYAFVSNQIVVFDTKTWGWITLLFGIVLFIAGLALLARMTWARWFGILVASVSFFHQLGFAGSSQYPLWSLTILVLTGVILYALIVRWNDAPASQPV